MNIGDTMDWASASYNDSHWKTTESIGPFERNGFSNFENFGWVRKKVFIPLALKSPTEKYGYFYLSLGRINDADETFFNGKLVGQTGSMPPDTIGVNRGQRIYKINAKKILWDKENQVAVRIFSNFRNGGLWGENFSIIVPSEVVFHAVEKNISAFPLSQGQQSFGASTRVDSSYRKNALKAGGLSLRLNLPERSSVFYNNQYIGITNSSGEHSFFVPAPLISWSKQDKIAVYTDDKNALEKLLFSTPTFTTIQGNAFNFMQISNFEIKKGSFNNNSPVTVSVDVFNTTNSDFQGDLILTLTTDINKIQQSLTYALQLNKMQREEIDFTLLPDFSGIYQVNYTLRKKDTGQQITGTLIKGEKL
jgi:hypothetical protein